MYTGIFCSCHHSHSPSAMYTVCLAWHTAPMYSTCTVHMCTHVQCTLDIMSHLYRCLGFIRGGGGGGDANRAPSQCIPSSQPSSGCTRTFQYALLTSTFASTPPPPPPPLPLYETQASIEMGHDVQCILCMCT